MFSLASKVALVTGGSRGIGAQTSIALSTLGAKVGLSYLNGEAQASETKRTIEAQGGYAETLQFDTSDALATEIAISDFARRHGRLDILVANAGIAVDNLLLRVKEEEIERVMNVNLKGSLYAAREAIKVMMRARSGRIVFVSSVVALRGNSGQAVYAASKAALLGLTRTLAREYGSRGITVNAVAPGLIETDMTQAIADDTRESIKRAVALGRLGTAKEVASAIAFLCSNEASYITGETLRIDGGM